MANKAVCVGINDYPGTGSDLNGCVNDANDWADLLDNTYQIPVTKLLDRQATKSRMLDALDDLVTQARAGDVIVFTYSGHGTWVYDQGERDESDNRDEALCAHDGNILDDQIRKILRNVKEDVALTVISDSCHSGTVTRQMQQRACSARSGSDVRERIPRFLPPEDASDVFRSAMIPIRRRALYPESGMSEILLTGCNATEYSYDAYINGRYNGAMSATAIRLIKQNPGQTYRQLHSKMRQELPSGSWPQSPQLEGANSFKDSRLFSSFSSTSDDDSSDSDIATSWFDSEFLALLQQLFGHFRKLEGFVQSRTQRPD